MSATSISVIVPLYNEGRNVISLAEHLESLHGLHEIILVDASSDPDSIKVINKLFKSGTRKDNFIVNISLSLIHI